MVEEVHQVVVAVEEEVSNFLSDVEFGFQGKLERWKQTLVEESSP